MLCPPHLAEQWQAELRDKFHIDAELVLPSTAARLERGLPRRPVALRAVPDHVIVSTDFIKSDRRRDDFVRACPELVIVDEAHTCAVAAPAARGRHQRHELRPGARRRRRPAPHPRHRDAALRQGGGVPLAARAARPGASRDLPDDLSGDDTRRATAGGSPGTSCSAAAPTSAHYLDEQTPFPERD